MTTQTTTNPAVAFIREGAQVGHWYLDGTMADVTAEQAHYAPPGLANPIGATFAHVVCSEDLIVNGMLRQQAPLMASSHATPTGLSEPMPMPGSPDWGAAYGAWARRVQVDLAELVSLDIRGLEFSSAGLIVTLRVSKTDQEKSGRRLGIPFGSSEATCPVRAVQAWLETARIVDGPVFRPMDRFYRVQPTRLSDKAVALIVKHRAKAVGLDPARYAGHSLRAGLATSAAAAGASERVIMSQTGHRSADMVRKYIREGNLFISNPAGMVGL